MHLPLHHEGFRQWRLDKIAEYRPDVVVNLGDWHDSDYASRWGDQNDDHDWDSETEFALLAQDAKDIREAASPDARIVFLLGNHDDNGRCPGRVPKKVRASVEEPRLVCIAAPTPIDPSRLVRSFCRGRFPSSVFVILL